jgi:GntR family transcriptional regulator
MLVSIDDRSPLPPGEQLKSQLEAMIIGRTVQPGARLPSIRQLAADLKVAPGTVARVYKELEASGHLTTNRTGTTVASLGARADQERSRHLDEAARTFVNSTTRAGIRLTEALEAVRRAYRERPQRPTGALTQETLGKATSEAAT